MHIWLLHGYAGSGKDSAGGLLKGILSEKETIVSSFAAAAKDDVAAMYDLDRSILDTQTGKQKWLYFADGSYKQVRTLLIEHAEGEKTKYNNPYIWAERINKPENCQHWIFTDWRFIGELECLRRRFPEANIHTVRIQRPGVVPLLSHTEHELDLFPSQFYLDNSGSLLYVATQLSSILEQVLHR